MKSKNLIRAAAALLCCFLFGCAAAFCLYLFDAHFDMPAPLEGGQRLDLSAFGFTMRVPDSFSLNDYTANHISEGGNALFAGCAYSGGQELYLYCYENEAGDDIAAHPEKTLIAHYVSAGAQQVRTRTLGSRRFICYRSEIAAQSGTEIWDSYETWNEDIHLVFETRMNPWDVLPILQTIDFTPSTDDKP